MGQSGAHAWELPFTMRKEGLHLQLRGGKAVPVSIPMMNDQAGKGTVCRPPPRAHHTTVSESDGSAAPGPAVTQVAWSTRLRPGVRVVTRKQGRCGVGVLEVSRSQRLPSSLYSFRFAVAAAAARSAAISSACSSGKSRRRKRAPLSKSSHHSRITM